MRNMSFNLTVDQFKAQTKTVTRRMGWLFLEPGEVLMGCEKCMGLKPGEKIVRLGRIRVVSVRRERLLPMEHDKTYGKREAKAEGFPQLSGSEFVDMFCRKMNCSPYTFITRIEFEYLDERWERSFYNSYGNYTGYRFQDFRSGCTLKQNDGFGTDCNHPKHPLAGSDDRECCCDFCPCVENDYDDENEEEYYSEGEQPILVLPNT